MLIHSVHFGSGHFVADDSCVAGFEFSEVRLQKIIDRVGRGLFEPLIDHLRDLAVVLFFGGAVGEAAVAEAANIAVESRPDVPEFVNDGIQFFAQREVQKPGQIEIKDIEHIMAVVVFDLLHAPFTAATDGVAFFRLGSGGGVRVAIHSRAGA